jgi:hypothetical protein
MKMPDESDPYWKLRPEWATPEDEICQCVDQPPIVLQEHLSSLPLACLKCNGEVPPERLGFDAKLAERIAFWRNLHRALYTLWLDSGDYEDWGRAQLEDPEGQVNRSGIEIVKELNAPPPYVLLVVRRQLRRELCSAFELPALLRHSSWALRLLSLRGVLNHGSRARLINRAPPHF